jgi:hypothetical protein
MDLYLDVVALAVMAVLPALLVRFTRSTHPDTAARR